MGFELCTQLPVKVIPGRCSSTSVFSIQPRSQGRQGIVRALQNPGESGSYVMCPFCKIGCDQRKISHDFLLSGAFDRVSIMAHLDAGKQEGEHHLIELVVLSSLIDQPTNRYLPSVELTVLPPQVLS